ncbi:hypothetical protein Hdeb2414_s0019g00539881 [Helianthus debilis subsp. tardiflorus]
MAAPPARARADYDYLIKLLLIGGSALMPANLGLEGSHVQIHRITTSCLNLDTMSKGRR